MAACCICCVCCGCGERCGCIVGASISQRTRAAETERGAAGAAAKGRVGLWRSAKQGCAPRWSVTAGLCSATTHDRRAMREGEPADHCSRAGVGAPCTADQREDEEEQYGQRTAGCEARGERDGGDPLSVRAFPTVLQTHPLCASLFYINSQGTDEVTLLNLVHRQIREKKTANWHTRAGGFARG